MKNYIAYTRVSTLEQGIGLDAQLAIIKSYIHTNGGQMIARYEEKQSGKSMYNRQELQAAISQCKKENAILIVAKLDRLSRDIVDIFTLKRDARLQFEVCDCDAQDTMTLGIFAALAQKEREMISKRTKDALAALKAKGVKLGRPDAAEHIRQYTEKAIAAHRANARNNENNRRAWAVLSQLDGTLQSKANFLNENGFTTARGGKFGAEQVRRIIAMFNKE